MIKILVADDHAILRRGIKQIISDTLDMTVAAEASNGQEVMQQLAKNCFDVVLLDISMPGKSGLDVIKEIRILKPALPVLILSMYPEDQYAIRLLKSGASGYLTKESAPSELVKAIRKVARGGKYVSSTLAEKIAHYFGDSSKEALHESLSNREYQVMLMIASGLTPTEIAQKLFLSVKTISTFRSRILDKMNMKNNSELTHYVISNKLI
ncbi:MAG: response regulator transcription factor [Dissulfurispiraceae bacterium]|nr:response regulator transcription factor [Dissulfurispiraceae bacterium]